jgi:membrane-associated phospholipid phosphatase
MERTLAKIISYTFHPLLIPLYSLFLIFRLNTLSIYIIPDQAKWLIVGMVTIATIAFPFLLILLFIRRGIIKSLQMEEREERLYPYLMMTVVYYVMYLLFNSVKIPHMVTNLMLGIALILLTVLIINLWWKISIHTAAIGGMMGAFLAIAARYYLDLQWLIAFLILVAGLVGYARLKLDTHRPSQIYMGFLVGATGMILIYFLI